MDGNGRWARSRGLERFLGHRKGTQATIDAVEVGVNLKLEHMTLYVFSSENWGRPSKEVDYLMNLLIEMVVKESPGLMEKNVKLKVIGNMERLPEKPRAKIDENVFARNLYLKGAPDPDLVIRTGGEFRLSNYLLWQAAYSEFYVTDTLWPDFTKEEFLKAVEFFKTRERRFGKVLHE